MSGSRKVTDVFFLRPDPDQERNVFVIKYRDLEEIDSTIGKVKKAGKKIGYIQIDPNYGKDFEQILEVVRNRLGIEITLGYEFEEPDDRFYKDVIGSNEWYSLYEVKGKEYTFIAKIRDTRTKTKGVFSGGAVYAEISHAQMRKKTYIIRLIKAEFETDKVFKLGTDELLG